MTEPTQEVTAEEIARHYSAAEEVARSYSA